MVTALALESKVQLAPLMPLMAGAPAAPGVKGPMSCMDTQPWPLTADATSFCCRGVNVAPTLA
jgi:hypothetical protein